MIKILHHLFNKYFIIFLGFIMFLTFIWFRFIRERLPRDIPFNLSVSSFFVLVEITLIYLFVCISFASSSNNNKFSKALVDWLFIPLDELHIFLRKHLYTSKFFDKYYSFILKYNEIIIINFKIIYIISRICPRVILLSALCIDIFYFNQLFYIYKVLLFGIIILIARLIIYSIKMYEKELLKECHLYIKAVNTKYIPGIIKEDENDDDDDIPTTIFIPLEKYVELRMNSRIQEEKEFKPVLSRKDLFHNIKKNLSTTEEKKQFNMHIKTQFKNLLIISVWLKYYTLIENHFTTTTFMIFFTYYICWGSILTLSIHTLNIFELLNVLNYTWLKIPNPFF